MNPSYPFSALVGQDDLKLALLLNAVDPSIGGLLIRGERGTAKSTAARGLSSLLPAAADGATVPFVELPLGATEDRVTGSLEIETALREGKQKLREGLLSKANGGVLYVDEVNLLPDHLVDLLLDSAANGQVTIERDGLSATAPARFFLIGSMNPEEGELRPQFLDRFGLCVEVKAPAEIELRVETIQRRRSFEKSPQSFCATWENEQQNLRTKILAARDRLQHVVIDKSFMAQASSLCAHLKLDGLRGDITLIKTAQAYAAWKEEPSVSSEHLRVAARFALPHRRRRKPFEPVDSDQSAFDQHLNPSPDNTPTGRDSAETSSSPDSTPKKEQPDNVPQNDRPAPPAKIGGTVQASVEISRSATIGRRTATNGAQGGIIRSAPFSDSGPLAIAPTLTAAANRGARVADALPNLQRDDLRTFERAGRGAARVLFVVDASGSMAAQRRLSLAKGAAQDLLTGNYQQRDEVALMVFRDDDARLLLPFTRTVEHLETKLRDIPTGGRTPLAKALHETSLIAQRTSPLVVVLFTDGRANVPLHEGDPWEQALAQARAMSHTIAGAIVVDCESGVVRLERASALAQALGAECVRLDELDTASLTLRLQGKPSRK